VSTSTMRATAAAATGGCTPTHANGPRYLQDQLIIFMALANGVSRIRSGPLTLHTETAIHFSSLLTGARFTVTRDSGPSETFVIECHGIGFKNAHLPAASQ